MSAAAPDASRLLVFSTDTFQPNQRLDAWNDAFGSLNAITVPADGQGFPDARCEYWMMGSGLILSQTRIASGRFVRDPLRTRRDQLDHWVLRVLRRGRSRLAHSAFEAEVGPGDLVLFSMHDTWTADWDQVEWVSLTMPRDFDLRLSSGLAALRPGIQRGAGAGFLSDLMLALPSRVQGASDQEVSGLTAALHAAIGACLLTGAGVPALKPGVESATTLAKERVRRAVLRNIASPHLTPAELAAAAGMSRSALYRLFEADGGVARYVRNVRLALAQGALRDPALAHQSIAAIAEAHGFPEPTDFSRAFRAVYGVAPRDVRSAGPVGSTSAAFGRRPPPTKPIRDLAARIYAREPAR